MRATKPPSHGIVRRLVTVVRAVSRYDLVLALIPVALAGGALVGATPGVPDSLGVGSGGLLALAATAYALFGDPPFGPRNGSSPSRHGPGNLVTTPARRRN